MAAENNGNETSASSPTPASSCPVMKRSDATLQATAENKSGGLWSRFFSVPKDTIDAPPSTNTTSESRCPVNGSKPIPASIEEAAKHSQFPSPGQKTPLATSRVVSSIPRGNESEEETKPFPQHQPTDSSKWMYPSEQQFYNAMIKKGYRPPIEAIPDVLRIHNAVNERSWLQVCKWEKELHGNADPKLVKFVGKPKDLSPKAWFNSRVLMTQEPFDRHDWYVEGEDGKERRYVIDFYEGKEKTDVSSMMIRARENSNEPAPIMKPPSMYIDARPALDNPSAAVDRLIMGFRETLPGIASAYDSYILSSASNLETTATDVGSKSLEQTEKQSS